MSSKMIVLAPNEVTPKKWKEKHEENIKLEKLVS